MRTLLLFLALLAPPVQAAPCTAVSGDTRNRLLELYTSEGCSSCPPADRWLSALPPDSGVVPLAFHVDYWDRLGWRDPYAQAAFSQRQRTRNGFLGWVYTPQLMLDGADFRAWHRGLPAAPNTPAPLRLTLTLDGGDARIEAHAASRFARPEAARGAVVYLALYQNRLRSQVRAGENAGRSLRHDHVVRQLAGPFDPSSARARFILQPGWNVADLGVAAFVLDAHGATLQALARPACAG
jgi:hypothetical protein